MMRSFVTLCLVLSGLWCADPVEHDALLRGAERRLCEIQTFFDDSQRRPLSSDMPENSRGVCGVFCGEAHEWWKQASWKKRLAFSFLGTVTLGGSIFLIFVGGPVTGIFGHMGASKAAAVSSGLVCAPAVSGVMTAVALGKLVVY